MIHSSRVIDRIIELIKLAGVSDDPAIEEMTDHYLTQIELLVDNGITEQQAIRETYQEIAKSDLSTLKEKGNNNSKWITVIAMAILSLFIVMYPCKNKEAEEIIIADNQILNVPNGWPIENNFNQITSNFGLRLHPIKNSLKFHKGIDIKAPIGTPVVSTGKGTIIDAGYNSIAGNYIIIKHNKLYSTRYIHLSQIGVTINQKVDKGQSIGLVGTTGVSIAPHLHYEVIKNETEVDPMDIIAP